MPPSVTAPADPVTVKLPVAVVGDVHGQYGMLDGLLARLDREAPDHTVVFLGDFVDRGPDAKRVVARVIAMVAGGRAAAVMGNHDLALVRAAGLDGKPVSPWWRHKYRTQYDAAPTLKSYLGRTPSLFGFDRDLDALRDEMPESHRRFLADLPWLVSVPQTHETCGYLFLHAGLSRALDLSAPQQVGALVRKCWDTWMVRERSPYSATAHAEYPPWIGADRLACADPLPLTGFVQVTGHETVDEPVFASNVIRIDTSGGRYEPLTACLLDRSGGARFVSYPEAKR